MPSYSVFCLQTSKADGKVDQLSKESDINLQSYNKGQELIFLGVQSLLLSVVMRNQLCSLYGKVILTIYHLVLITISTVYTGENILNVHINFGINKSVEGLYVGVNYHIIMTGVTNGAPEFNSDIVGVVLINCLLLYNVSLIIILPFCLFFPFWSLYCLSLFKFPVLITLLGSSNLSCLLLIEILYLCLILSNGKLQ